MCEINKCMTGNVDKDDVNKDTNNYRVLKYLIYCKHTSVKEIPTHLRVVWKIMTAKKSGR